MAPSSPWDTCTSRHVWRVKRQWSQRHGLAGAALLCNSLVWSEVSFHFRWRAFLGMGIRSVTNDYNFINTNRNWGNFISDRTTFHWILIYSITNGLASRRDTSKVMSCHVNQRQRMILIMRYLRTHRLLKYLKHFRCYVFLWYELQY